MLRRALEIRASVSALLEAGVADADGLVTEGVGGASLLLARLLTLAGPAERADAGRAIRQQRLAVLRERGVDVLHVLGRVPRRVPYVPRRVLLGVVLAIGFLIGVARIPLDVEVGCILEKVRRVALDVLPAVDLGGIRGVLRGGWGRVPRAPHVLLLLLADGRRTYRTATQRPEREHCRHEAEEDERRS